MQKDYIIGSLQTCVGKVNEVATHWSWVDKISTLKVRWAIGRMRYKVKQGLYAVGKPTETSPIFVTANFKLSFDHLRKAIDGFNAWILVLDTKGINVWCAAGKGTFGTKELVYRIKAHGLDKLVTHRKIIVPQLGATGIAAYEVKEKTGFTIIYGPVRAKDIAMFMQNGLKATHAMRRVTFPLIERIKLIPVEISYAGIYLLLVPAVFFLLSGINKHGYSIDYAWKNAGFYILWLFLGYVAGCVLTPILLPLIPFKRFSLKGFTVGSIVFSIAMLCFKPNYSYIELIAWFLMVNAIASFMAMNFTGSSTFTSLSGVKKEMKIALPAQIIAAGLSFILWMLSKFV